MCLHISVCAKQSSSSSLSSQRHLLCCLFLLMVSPSSLPPRLKISLLLPPLQQPSAVDVASLFSPSPVPSSVLIAAALIQVLITSCLDCSSNLPSGLSASLKSVLRIRWICLKYRFHHVLTLLNTSQWLFSSLQTKIHIHSRCGLCDIISHYSFHAAYVSTKTTFYHYLIHWLTRYWTSGQGWRILKWKVACLSSSSWQIPPFPTSGLVNLSVPTAWMALFTPPPSASAQIPLVFQCPAFPQFKYHLLSEAFFCLTSFSKLEEINSSSQVIALPCILLRLCLILYWKLYVAERKVYQLHLCI